jgi:ABC-type lipoprotein export system ATPase subunit
MRARTHTRPYTHECAHVLPHRTRPCRCAKGGEQQRVTIARALANNPNLLLLDEPTGDLDTKNTVEIMNLLLDINQTQAITCVMVTHNPDLECYAHRILYVEDGKVCERERVVLYCGVCVCVCVCVRACVCVCMCVCVCV